MFGLIAKASDAGQAHPSGRSPQVAEVHRMPEPLDRSTPLAKGSGIPKPVVQSLLDGEGSPESEPSEGLRPNALQAATSAGLRQELEWLGG
ncbi:hypothetical protein GUJ93_ZPchr0012g21952 [Zizania palustris]|uniref:Uncharacterized protein n=1 Tax=Zizania palustris TaxID=103762 RepID=A0A8J5WQ01_ZIZPA|nr:hypothetical protein GUJ93_ZPchr0012g21952 [Zizania palustris]